VSSTCNCFPFSVLFLAVSFTCSAGTGAWPSAYDAEQSSPFRNVHCTKPQTFEEVRSRRVKAEKDGTWTRTQQNGDGDDGRVLDGFFLVTASSCFIPNWKDTPCIATALVLLTGAVQPECLLIIRQLSRGIATGGYIGIYIQPKSVTVLFTCGTLTYVLKLQ